MLNNEERTVYVPHVVTYVLKSAGIVVVDVNAKPRRSRLAVAVSFLLPGPRGAAAQWELAAAGSESAAEAAAQGVPALLARSADDPHPAPAWRRHRPGNRRPDLVPVPRLALPGSSSSRHHSQRHWRRLRLRNAQQPPRRRPAWRRWRRRRHRSHARLVSRRGGAVENGNEPWDGTGIENGMVPDVYL